MEKICEHCGEPFEAKRKDVVYCSASCRQMAYMNRKFNFSANTSDQGKINFAGVTLNGENSIEAIDSPNEENLSEEVETDSSLDSNEHIGDKESSIPEQINYESKFNNAMVELFNDREYDTALNSCFYSKKSAPIYWVSIRLKCLVECLLMFSEMKFSDVDDLKEVCNAFILMTRSDCFIELPPNFPYKNYILNLREKLKQVCINNNELERIKFRISRENKIELMVTRFELSHFIPKKKFGDLDFGEYSSK